MAFIYETNQIPTTLEKPFWRQVSLTPMSIDHFYSVKFADIRQETKKPGQRFRDLASLRSNNSG